MYKCKHCSQEFEKPKSIASHTKWCKLNPNRYIPFNLSEVQKDKRLKKVRESNSDSNLIQKRSESIRKTYSKGLNRPRKELSQEEESLRRSKISETMKLNPNAGGLRHGSGRGKKGWYKGVWCDSSWELAWVIYHLDRKIPFERCQESFQYNYKGKFHKYYPDFKLGSTYVEVKGRKGYAYLDQKTKHKLLEFKGALKVLFEEDMKPILNWVEKVHGRDFIRLYEK